MDTQISKDGNENAMLFCGKRKRGFTSCEDMAALSPKSEDEGKQKEKSHALSDAGLTRKFMSESHKLNIKQIFYDLYSNAGKYKCYMENVVGDQNAMSSFIPIPLPIRFHAAPIPSKFVASLDNDPHVLEHYGKFEKYGVVNDHSDHLIGVHSLWPFYCHINTVLEDRECFKNLPGIERIYVRVYEPMTDLLRAVIIGAEGTPYHDGLFFFDVSIACRYGRLPPRARYHSAGFQIHPYIYECGEVADCLYKSSAEGENVVEDLELFDSSNLLQYLVTIRDVFLNKNPLFSTIPYYGNPASTENDDAQVMSLLYNEVIIIRSLKTMVHVMNKPPKHFEDLVVGHFRSRVRHILMACESYMEGKFLEGEEEGRCSITFRNEVASCIRPLVEAFKKIGAKEAEEFLHLSDKTFPLPDEP